MPWGAEQKQVAKIIAEQNDQFRKLWGAGFTVPGHVVMTAAVSELGAGLAVKIMQAVQSYDDFTPDNDSNGEHEFGIFEIEGTTFNWKIDLYGPSYRHGSEHCTEPTKTRRVLTVMTSKEY